MRRVEGAVRDMKRVHTPALVWRTILFSTRKWEFKTTREAVNKWIAQVLTLINHRNKRSNADMTQIDERNIKHQTTANNTSGHYDLPILKQNRRTSKL